MKLTNEARQAINETMAEIHEDGRPSREIAGIPALVVVAAVVGVLAFLAESLTDAIENLTEPPRRR